MTSILIALSEPFVRLGVQTALAEEPEFRVSGVVERVADVLTRVAELRPDIVILETSFQEQSPALLSTLAKDHPACRVLMMVDHTDEKCTVRSLFSGPRTKWPDLTVIRNLKECCLNALRESARGCLPKASSPESLVAALRAVAAGEIWAGPGLSSYLVSLLDPAKAAPVRPLTAREIEVIGLLVDGLSNKRIAARLKLGEQTVKNHVARIMDKLGVHNRVELVLLAVRQRLV